MRLITTGIAFLGLAAIFALVPVHAQQEQPNCTPGRDLVTIPDIKSHNGRLRGVVTLADEERALAGSADGKTCNWQHLRYFKGYSLDSENPPAWPSGGDILPGPTLRARVGDLVQLAFFNQIDVSNFSKSLDQAERGETGSCDTATATRQNSKEDGTRTTQIYPQNPDGTPGDTAPNCLHGSSTANIHFHGTHTTPSTTGDNVLLSVRPALREAGNVIGPVEENVMRQFEQIWKRCESNGPPTEWDQLPQEWRNDQTGLLQQYDKTAAYKGVIGDLPDKMRLWPKNEEQLKKGLWPQYSIGAFPYCFRLPEYAPPNVRMGQAPGTHWYHAHKHGSTALNVGNGMAGAFVIEGAYDDTLRKFYRETPEHKNWGLKEQVLVIQQLETALNLLSAGQGSPPPLSVNGRLNPVVTMRPGEVQMWRVVNAAARSFVQFDTFATHGKGGLTLEWRQIAQDGVQFSYENYERFGAPNNKFNLAGANRADLLVKAPMHEAEYELQVVLSVSDTPSNSPVTLLTVRVKSDGKKIDPPMDFIKDEKDFPEFPPYLKDIPDRAYTKRELVYNTTPSPGRRGKGKMPRHEINGELFNGDHISKSMILNTVEEWTVINKTVGIAHPFHIHINPFQVVEVFQPSKCDLDPTKPDTWKACKKLTPPFVWWDTFAIPTAQAKVLDASVCTQLANCPAEIKDYTTCGENKDTKKEECTVTIPGYFKMRSDFADFTGMFVNHCHILAHEDRGMMQLIQVIDKPKNYYDHH